VEAEFTYIHMAENQFLTVWPSSRIDDWRYLGPAENDTVVFGEFTLGSEEMIEQISVAKTLLNEIEADVEAWQPLRARLTEGSFVDVLRLHWNPRRRTEFSFPRRFARMAGTYPAICPAHVSGARPCA
jgi:hypothetical protein